MLSCPRISSLMSATREGHRGNVHKRIVAALLSHRGFYWFSKKGHSGGFFWQDPTLGLRPLWIFHKASPATAHVSAGRHTALYCTLPPNVGASIQWSSKLYRKVYRRSSLHKPIEEMVSLCDGSDCFDCWWDVQVSKHQLYTFFWMITCGIQDISRYILVTALWTPRPKHTYSHSEITRDEEYIQTQVCTDLHIHTRYISV